VWTGAWMYDTERRKICTEQQTCCITGINCCYHVSALCGVNVTI